MRSLLSPLVKGRAPLFWYAAVLLLPPASQYAALLLYKSLGHPMPSLSPWSQLPIAVVVLALFSVGEELGWRGFYLPEMARNYSPFTVAATMALFWGVWHLPFYLAINSEGQKTWLLYLLFLGGMFPVCALFVLIFSNTKSVLLCMLFHGSLNGGAAYCFGPLPTGELLPFALWIVLLWLIAIPAFIIHIHSQPKTLIAS
ncbi:MAG TPA: CPBP family intramembrane glutamic endopeptidase [Terracidiphilus sp.]|nr:CPBP family intramembrane glutamic endopeptidase [Terracidiphilus sp.]